MCIRDRFLSYRNRDRIQEQIERIDKDIRVVVATDGERILGLGDQGVGGMGIPNGKLSLYSAFGGIDPATTLPIMLDVGTNSKELLDNPEYLGWRHERITGKDYDDFIQEFVTALKDRFPKVLLQWEDFAQQNATRILDSYRDKVLSFNDDIQGTAAIALAVIWSAIYKRGSELADQRFVIVGAGSAGTGIAAMIQNALKDAGVSDPLKQIYLIDRRGIVHTGRDSLKSHQVDLAHDVEDLKAWSGQSETLSLDEIIDGAGATVLVGVSGQPGMFTEQAIKACLLYTSPSPRDRQKSRMPSSA